VGFNDAAVRIAEPQPGEVRVYRSRGSSGPISVRYALLNDTTDGADMAATAGTLTWADGDSSARTIPLVATDDAATEGEERFRIRLSDPTGGATLGVAEIDVTVEDDEALRALQFSERDLEIMEGRSGIVTLSRPAATPGPVVVRYAVAEDIDPVSGAPRPRAVDRLMNDPVAELRWSAEDISSRSITVRTVGMGRTQANETSYVALADVAGTLREGDDWKVARIAIVDNPALDTPPSGSGPSADPQSAQRSGGGGAVSIELMLLLALALLLRHRSRLGTLPWRHLSAARAECGDVFLVVRQVERSPLTYQKVSIIIGFVSNPAQRRAFHSKSRALRQ
jgi:hypothetical protein